MRQVTRRANEDIVRFWREAIWHRADKLPQVFNTLQRIAVRIFSRSQDACRVLEKRRPRSTYAGFM